jgi:Ser/Thr protein kinase RdoA (MazF antagonist)
MSVSFVDLTQRQQLAVLRPVAQSACAQFGITPQSLRMVNHGFNTTYAVTTASGARYALRLGTNSLRDPAGLAAELQWLDALAAAGQVAVAAPHKTPTGQWAIELPVAALHRAIPATLSHWLPGRIVGEKPRTAQLVALGQTMAQLHHHSAHWQPQGNAAFPLINTLWMNSPESISTTTHPSVTPRLRDMVAQAITQITTVYSHLDQQFAVQPIHADLHGYNLMWQTGRLSVFDFDDAGLGWPIQDLAISAYHVRDIPGAEHHIRAGYAQVGPIPQVSDAVFESLLMARGLLLFNDLLAIESAGERAFIPEYCRRMELRLQHFLTSGTFALLQ